VDRDGKARKTSSGARKNLADFVGTGFPREGDMPAGQRRRQDLINTGFTFWTGSWELSDLPSGIYTVELTAFDKAGKPITARSVKLLHGDPPAPRRVPQE
jgi:hypothetical protein